MVNERLIEIYGNPDADNNGLPDLKWESQNIVRITPPYRMFWSWNSLPVKTISIHRKCADTLEEALTAVGKRYTAQERAWYGLDQCAGGYNFRPQRTNASKLSFHAFGAAIDLAPLQNPQGKRYDESQRMMPREVIAIFKGVGWSSGAFWGLPDSMHFQKI